MSTHANLEHLLASANIPISQARVYIAGLELGSATLSDIMRHTSLSKTTTFEALQGLRERKFVRITRRQKSVTYRMCDPEHAIEILRAYIAEQSSLIDDIARAMPIFQALQGGKKPSTLIYEGADAVHGYFAHLDLVKPKNIDEISNGDDIYSWIDEKILMKCRKQYTWKAKSGRSLSSGERRNPSPIFKQRRLNPAWGEFHGNLALYGDYVSLVTYTKRLTTIIIHSKSLANSMRMMFEIAWRASNEACDVES